MPHSALAIVGMRRSGTSSVCLALNRLGVSFGSDSKLFRGDEFNEEGYWEHRSIIGLHRAFRMSLNLRAVDLDPMPADWRERPATNHFLTHGVRILKESFLNLPGPWAWKDPDASLALPFVMEVAARTGFEPHFLVCVRNPADTARSEARRKSTPELETIGSWLAHTLTALRDSTGHSRSVIVFEEFIKHPRGLLQPVVEALGLSPTEEQWADAVSSVNPGLVHNRSEMRDLDKYPSLVKRTYAACQSLQPDEMRACAEEYELWRQMFHRPSVEEATLSALWERGGENRYAESTYRPNGGWQTVVIETDALPASSVQLFLYPLPANVWIRRAAWRHGDQVTEASLMPGSSGNLRQQFGMACVSLIHGPDHIVLKTPPVKGPFTLELEFLVESNNLITGDTYKVLSDLLRGGNVKL